MFRLTLFPLLLLISLSALAQSPSVVLSRTSLSYSSLLVGSTSKPQSVTLSNTGGAGLNISGISITGDFAQTNNCGTSVAAGASCTISVTFTPTAVGNRSGVLTISDNAGTSPQVVKLHGPGVLVAVQPTTLRFPVEPLNLPTSPMAATLYNYASQPYAINGITTSGSFTVQQNNCGTSIPANSSCTILIVFDPTTPGAQTGKLSISDAAFGSPQFSTLAGTGGTTSLQRINVTPLAKSIGIGEAQKFQAMAHFSDGSSQNVNSLVAWTTSDPSIAPLSANVATGSASGQATITATAASISGSATLNVSTVNVSPRTSSLTFTRTQQFQATIQGGADNNVSWSVDGISGGNPTVGTITTDGLYTPPQAVGSHQITAVSQDDPTQGGFATVTVTDYAGTLTYNNDNLRTSQNTAEQILTPDNVNSNQFGKLFSYPIDGYAYAQPLYMENVAIPGQGNHNVVFVATENDTVYAFDADNSQAIPLWQDSFANPSLGITSPPGQIGGSEIGAQSGISGTPVIDPATGTLYVAVRTVENSTYIYRLHALDVSTGAEKFGGPVVIQASTPGTGTGSKNGVLPFYAQYQHNRPALLLANGVLYIAFGILGCEGPTCPAHHGWVLAYNPATLALVGALCTTPNQWGASIWHSGGGPGADAAGNVFVTTGNGPFDGNSGGSDFGFSVLKYSMTGGILTLSDWFTPYNWTTLQPDYDLSSSGPLLLPDQPGLHPHLMIADGKKGTLYLIDRDNMGKFNATADQIVQEFHASGGVWGKPSYWNNRVYLSDGTYLYIYPLNNGLLQSASPVKKSYQYGYPGPIPAISSAPDNSNGILWMIQTHGYVLGGYPSVLHAYDPINGMELYNSSQAGTRDTAGAAVKFAVPTVANGKVYVGTQNELDVYGLLPN